MKEKVKQQTKDFLHLMDRFPFNLPSFNLVIWLEYSKEYQDKYKDELIKQHTQRIIKNNLTYFRSNEYQDELREFKSCLSNAKKGIIVPNCKYNKIIKIIKIYNSNISNFEKNYQIRKSIKDVEEFYDLFSPFVVTSYNNNIIKTCISVYKSLTLDILPDMNNEDVIKEVLKIYELYFNDKNNSEIKRLKEEFLKKYKRFFDSSLYKNKFLYLKQHLAKTKSYRMFEKLEQALEIYNSSINDYEKINKITSIIGNKSSDIFKIISPYAITFIDEPFIQETIRLYLFVKSYDSKIKHIKETIKGYEDYKDYYEYAKYIIECYINDPYSYQTSTFFRKYNINKDIFIHCVNAIIIFNDSLYDKYLEKKNQNKDKRIDYVQSMMEDLMFGIKYGYLKDGTILTPQEFLRRVPLKFYIDCTEFYKEIRENRIENSHMLNFYREFVKRLEVYVKYVLKDDENLLKKYMYLNGIDQYSIYTIDKMIKENEKNEFVIKYMQHNKYPMIWGIYIIMLEKFNKGEITEEDIKGYQYKKYKPILTL